MKRIITILLSLLIFSSLLGCSAGKKEIKIGETVTWKDFEIRFDKVAVGNNLYTSPSYEDFLMPGSEQTYVQGADGKQYNKAYKADDNHTYVCVRFFVKFNGKSRTEQSFRMKVMYKNEYEFDGNTALAIRGSGNWSEWHGAYPFEPLQGEKQFVAVITVPREVENAEISDIKIILENLTLNLE